MNLLDPCQLCGDLGLLSPAPSGTQVCRTCFGVAALAAEANQRGLEESDLINALGQAAATVRAQNAVRR